MWAAIAAEAPADFSMNNNRQEILQKMKDVNRPVMIVKGDMDEAVPVTNTWMWVDTHERDEAELPARGSSRGPVIETGLKPPSQFSPSTPGNKG
jgi:esterase/lipase